MVTSRGRTTAVGAIIHSTLLLFLLLTFTLVSIPANAQLARVGATRSLATTPIGGLIMGPDVAFDPVNNVYLVLIPEELQGGGRIRGQFLDPSGAPLGGSPFLIQDNVQPGFARAIYSPFLSDGAGGSGAFLVSWGEVFGTRVRTVAYPNRVVLAEQVLTFDYSPREMALAPITGRFLAVWESYGIPTSIWVRQINVNGVPFGDPVALASGNGARPWVLWNAITSVQYNPARGEFAILYGALEGGTWVMRFARVRTGDMLIQSVPIATVTREPIAGTLQYNSSTGNYVAVWAEPDVGVITGAELGPTGSVIAIGPLPSSIVGSEEGLGLTYNPHTGTFLLLGYRQVQTSSQMVRGMELNQHGAPNSPVLDLFDTSVQAITPRAAVRSNAAEWIVVAGSGQLLTQMISTSTLAGGSSLRLDGCANPDPFAAQGGGTCAGGNWVAPGGCVTPDPFVALGGGTCYNGNWLPPGMPIPDVATTPAPPPAPNAPGGCSTPDPFVALGGGTCYNGNWLPPGMPIPGEATTPPSPSLPPPPSTGCSTPDPFVALGGGTCYNGNWLPPGMPLPGQPTTPSLPPPPAPAPSPGGCATPDPFVALGGGTCYNGNWLPPGMPIPGGAAPVPTIGGCTTPDPFVALGGGTCYSGNWLPPGMPIQVEGAPIRIQKLNNNLVSGVSRWSTEKCRANTSPSI